jgi:hypothetical protein
MKIHGRGAWLVFIAGMVLFSVWLIRFNVPNRSVTNEGNLTAQIGAFATIEMRRFVSVLMERSL